MESLSKSILEKYFQQIANIVDHPWELQWNSSTVTYESKLFLGDYQLINKSNDKTEEKCAGFKLYPMINCCGICVSTQAWVHPKHKNKGLGTILNSMRIDIAREIGYGLLMCTDIETNEPQRKILRSNGWKDVHKFVNPRTRNVVYISVINL